MPLSLHAATNRPSPSQASSLRVRPSQQARRGLLGAPFSWRHHLERSIRALSRSTGGCGGARAILGPPFPGPAGLPVHSRGRPENWTTGFRRMHFPATIFAGTSSWASRKTPWAIMLRNLIGVDNLMWGSDYPHQESTFPRSKQILEEILADCTQGEKAKIAGGNAERVYRLD